jgi:uncharacterized protein
VAPVSGDESLTVTSSDGLKLEAALAAPSGPSGAKAKVVLCHPHPKLGGTMNAPLLLALQEELVRRDFAVLRFNFRGIGESEGQSSLGLEEVADAEGAVAHSRSLGAELPVAVVGWSFGAVVAVRTAARDDALAGCVAIAPAVKPKPEVSVGLPPAREVELDVPVLLVCAANDELVACDDCSGWAEEASADKVVVGGANHFFWGKYKTLGATVGGWLDTIV